MTAAFCPSVRQSRKTQQISHHMEPIRSATIPLCSLLVILLSLFLFASDVSAQSQKSTFRLNIVMTAGIRGHMMPVQNSLSDCTVAQLPKLNCSGGVSRRSAFIHSSRLAYPNRTLAIDVGNFYFGTLFQKLDRGSVVANLFSMSGYDATGLGVADFFGGPKDLGDYLTALSSTIEVISSNIDVSAETALPSGRIKPFTVFTLADGREVGLVGCTDDQIATVSNSGQRVIVNGGGNYTCNSLMARSISFMKRLHPDVNIIIAINAVSHINMDQSLDIAQTVEGIDIVLCEFPPADLLTPSRVVQSLFGNPVLIAAIPLISDPFAYPLGGSILNFQVDFDMDGIIQLNTLNLNLQLLDRTQPDDIQFFTDPGTPTPTPGLVNKALDQISALSKQVVGKLGVDLVGNTGSWPTNTSWLCRNTGCNLGMFVSESLLDWCSDCEISHFNTGGLRQDLSTNTLDAPPSITRKDLLNLLPFGNTLISYNIYGLDLMKAIALKSISSRGTNGFQQMSGIRVAFNPSTKALVYMEIFDRKSQVWRPWNSDSLYKVATTNFVFRGGDSYDIAQYALNVNLFGPNDADNLVNSLQVYPNRTFPSLDQLNQCWATPFSIVNSWSGVPAYCTYAVSSSIANLATTCPTLNNTAFCSPGKLVYDGKYFNSSSNGCSKCSGLGSCAVGGTQTCVCDGPTTDGLFAGIQMIQGVACEQIRTKKVLPAILLQAFWFSGGFVALLLLVTFPYYFSIYFKNSYGILKSRVTNIVTFMLLWIGCSFGIIACALLLTPLSDTNCASIPWVLNLAFSFVMGALATRSYQVKQQQDLAGEEAKSISHRHAQMERRRKLAGQSIMGNPVVHTSMASLDLNAFEPSRSRPGAPAVSNYRALILFSLVLSVDIILLPMQGVLSPMQLGISTAEASCTLQQRTVVQSDWTYHETCTAKNDLQWRFYTANIVAKMVITLWALGMTNEFQAMSASQGQHLSLHGTHHAEMDWLRSSVFQMLGICILLLLLILSDSEMQVVIGGSVCGILALVLLLIGGVLLNLRKQQVEIRQRKEMAQLKEKSAAAQQKEAAKANGSAAAAVVPFKDGLSHNVESGSASSDSNSNSKDVNGVGATLPPSDPANPSEPQFHPSFAFGPFFVLHGTRARLARGILRGYSILFNYYRLVACFYILYQLPDNVQQATLSQAELDQSAALRTLDFAHSSSGICAAVTNNFDLLSQPICTQANVCPSKLFLARIYTSDNANTIIHTCSAHTALNLSYVFILFYLVYEAARHAWILLPSIAFIMHEQETQSQLVAKDTKKQNPPVVSHQASSPKSFEEKASPHPLSVAVTQHRAPHLQARLFDPASPSVASPQPPLSPKSFRIIFHPTQRQTVSIHPASPKHHERELQQLQQDNAQDHDHSEVGANDVKIDLDTPVSSSAPASAQLQCEREQHIDATFEDEKDEDAEAVAQARAEHLSRFYRSVFAIPLYLYRPVLLVSTPPEELAAQIASSRHTSSWIILAPYLLIEIPFVLTSICLALAFQKVDYQIVFAFLSAVKLALEVSACWSLRLRRDLKQLQNGTIKFA